VECPGHALGSIRPTGAYQSAGKRGNFIRFKALRLHIPLRRPVTLRID
jgi:hypothetical protein